jgi:hypothetical protein
MSKLMLIVVLQIVSQSMPNTIFPDGVVVHHSALTDEDIREFPGPVTISTIDALHEKRGYSVYFWGRVYHAGYHYLLLPDGTVQRGRPENCIGSHTRGYNQMIGICLVGNFSSREKSEGTSEESAPTSQQIKTLVQLIIAIRARYAIPCNKIYRHNDLNTATLCPGDRFPWQAIQVLIGCGPD